MTESVSQLMNDEAVYRAAPATPGVLNISRTTSLLNHKTWGAETLIEGSPLPTMDSWIVPAWSLRNEDGTRGLFPRGALKTMRRAGLDSWIVPGWSLKKSEVFRIELMYCPGLEP